MVLLTLKEMTEKYKVTEATIYNWRKKGLPVIKIEGTTRYDESEVDKWVRDRQVNQSAPGAAGVGGPGTRGK